MPGYVYSRTIDPEKAPDMPTVITIDFEKGDATAIDGKKLSPASLLTKLNELGRANGIGPATTARMSGNSLTTTRHKT